MDHYVYVHRRADTGEPFYVGKGSGRRAWIARSRTVFWKRIVAKHGLRVEVVLSTCTHADALEAEMLLIAMLGRIDTKTGPLVNNTDGGEGTLGRQVTDRVRLAVALANSERPTSEAQKQAVGARYRGKHGDAHNRSIRVRCVATGVAYVSKSAAEKALGLGGGSVSWSMKHNRPVFGMHFEALS